MPRRLFHRLFAATALLSLLAVSAATGGTWLRCRITGILLPNCCCPTADGADEGAPTPPTADADDCCDRVVTSVDQTPSEAPVPETLSLPAVTVATSVPADAAADRPAPAANEQSRAGPLTARARLLSKQTFLI